MTQQTKMEAELLFDHSDARDLAVVELEKRGYEVEYLDDWVDEYEGTVLSDTVWIKVRGISELSESEFFDEMAQLAEQFDGDCNEAGLADDPSQAA